MLKVYDIKTFQCYTPEYVNDNHKAAILQVRYSSNGKQLVTASRDGSIKLWDGVSGKCIKTIEHAHGHHEVSSVQFSKNGHYILSGGKDSTSKLWDISSGKLLLLSFTLEKN
jgi:cleavage stimulation factor subunit 1